MNNDEKKPETDIVIDDSVTGEVIDAPPRERNKEVVYIHFFGGESPREQDLLDIMRHLDLRPATIEDFELRPLQENERLPHTTWIEGRSTERLRDLIVPEFRGNETMDLSFIPFLPNGDIERPGSCQFCNAELKTEFPSRLCPVHGAVDCEDCLRPFTRDENRAVCTYCNKVRPEPIEPNKADEAITAEGRGEPYRNVPMLDFHEDKVRLTKPFVGPNEPWDERYRFLGFRKKEEEQ